MKPIPITQSKLSELISELEAAEFANKQLQDICGVIDTMSREEKESLNFEYTGNVEFIKVLIADWRKYRKQEKHENR